MSEISESVLPDEPSPSETAVQVISTTSLRGSDVQTNTVRLDQSENQVHVKQPVKNEDQHIPVKSPEVKDEVVSKEHAFQLLLNVLTGNYSDIPQAKAFKDSIIAALSNQAPAQIKSQSESNPISSKVQQETSKASGEVHGITDSELVYADDYLSDTTSENKRSAESTSSMVDTKEQNKVLHEPYVHVLEKEEISKSSPEPRITVESTHIQSESRVKQCSPKMELATNLYINTFAMDESSDVTLNQIETDLPPVQRSAETISDKDDQDHDTTTVPLQHEYILKETLQNTVQSTPSFQEHCADEDDDDYEEYVTNDEMEDDYQAEDDEEENEEIKLIMGNIIAVNESPKCSMSHENILILQDMTNENQLVLKKECENVTDNSADSDPPKLGDKRDSVNWITVTGADVSAACPQGMVTHSSRPTTNDTSSFNTESSSATSSTLTSTVMKAPVPPKRKLAKGIKNPPQVATPTTSNNNEAIIPKNNTDLNQSGPSSLEVFQTTDKDNQSTDFARENNGKVSEHVQQTTLHPVKNESLEKQDEITSPTDVSSKVTDQLQFEVSHKIKNRM